MKFLNNNLNSNVIGSSSMRSPWLIFAATILGVMMVNIDANIVNVALPVIAKNYSAKMEKVQWIISSYILVACVLLPICGRLSDIYTKRFIYLLGFAIFTFGSALCSISNSLTSLIVSRLVQGIGAAMIMSNNQALIVMNFPQELQGRALSVNSMSASFGAITGPAIGGLLLGVLGWRSIFYINIPIGIIGCLVGYYILPRNEERIQHTLDIIGAALFAIIITGVLLLLNNFSDGHWLTKQNLFLLLLSCVTSWFFWRRQTQTANPAINLALFKNHSYLRSNIAAFVIFMTVGGNSILLPFYLHDAIGLAPCVIGTVMLVLPCTMLVLAPVSGYLADKYPLKIFIALGLALQLVGLFLQGFFITHGAIWHVIMCQIIIGSGFAFFQPPNNVSLFKDIASTNFGTAASINALIRNVGRVFGVVMAASISALLFQHAVTTHIQSHNAAFLFGLKVAFYSLAATVLVALYFALKQESSN